MNDINVDMGLILNLRKIHSFLNLMYSDGYIYIALNNGEWKYKSTDNKYDGNDIYNAYGYEYMGTVNIDDIEFIEFDVKKYNI
jgi:hypothetical protein